MPLLHLGRIDQKPQLNKMEESPDFKKFRHGDSDEFISDDSSIVIDDEPEKVFLSDDRLLEYEDNAKFRLRYGTNFMIPPAFQKHSRAVKLKPNELFVFKYDGEDKNFRPYFAG